jgi:hypothetical protein
MATDFADLDTHLSDRERDNISSSSTPDDQSTEQTSLQPHDIHRSREVVHDSGLIDHALTTMNPEVCSPPSAVDSSPTSNVDQSNQPCKLVIGIESVVRMLIVAPSHCSLMICTRAFLTISLSLSMLQSTMEHLSTHTSWTDSKKSTWKFRDLILKES